MLSACDGRNIVKGPGKPKPPSPRDPELQGRILSAPDTPEAHEAAAEAVAYVLEVYRRRKAKQGQEHEEEDRHDTSRDAA